MYKTCNSSKKRKNRKRSLGPNHVRTVRGFEDNWTCQRTLESLSGFGSPTRVCRSLSNLSPSLFPTIHAYTTYSTQRTHLPFLSFHFSRYFSFYTSHKLVCLSFVDTQFYCQVVAPHCFPSYHSLCHWPYTLSARAYTYKHLLWSVNYRILTPFCTDLYILFILYYFTYSSMFLEGLLNLKGQPITQSSIYADIFFLYKDNVFLGYCNYKKLLSIPYLNITSQLKLRHNQRSAITNLYIFRKWNKKKQ